MANLANLLPNVYQQFRDGNGNPLAGGKLYSYQAGTTTPLATFTDATEGTSNTNPVTLDASGSANIWIGSSAYKFVLKDSSGNTVWTVDNVQWINDKYITSTMIGDHQVTTTQLANGSIVAGPIAPNSITSSLLAAGSIVAGPIAAGAITSSLIANGAVTSTQLATGAVGTAQITNGAITTSKLASGFVFDPTQLDSITGTFFAQSSSSGTYTTASTTITTVTNIVGIGTGSAFSSTRPALIFFQGEISFANSSGGAAHATIQVRAHVSSLLHGLSTFTMTAPSGATVSAPAAALNCFDLIWMGGGTTYQLDVLCSTGSCVVSATSVVMTVMYL